MFSLLRRKNAPRSEASEAVVIQPVKLPALGERVLVRLGGKACPAVVTAVADSGASKTKRSRRLKS